MIHTPVIHTPHQVLASFPTPGEYFLELRNVVEVPGGLPLKVDGISHPLALRLVISDEVLRVKVRQWPLLLSSDLRF